MKWAHLALSDFSDVIREFWQLSGWIFVKELNIKLPPTKLIINDSAESISEDFANHIEVYHFKPAYLKSQNPQDASSSSSGPSRGSNYNPPVSPSSYQVPSHQQGRVVVYRPVYHVPRVIDYRTIR